LSIGHINLTLRSNDRAYERETQGIEIVNSQKGKQTSRQSVVLNLDTNVGQADGIQFNNSKSINGRCVLTVAFSYLPAVYEPPFMRPDSYLSGNEPHSTGILVFVFLTLPASQLKGNSRDIAVDVVERCGEGVSLH
jgi:hypothetical protein